MGDTLATFLWLAVLFALSSQLNQLGFMRWAGHLLTSLTKGPSWPLLFVSLVAI